MLSTWHWSNHIKDKVMLGSGEHIQRDIDQMGHVKIEGPGKERDKNHVV